MICYTSTSQLTESIASFLEHHFYHGFLFVGLAERAQSSARFFELSDPLTFEIGCIHLHSIKTFQSIFLLLASSSILETKFGIISHR